MTADPGPHPPIAYAAAVLEALEDGAIDVAAAAAAARSLDVLADLLWERIVLCDVAPAVTSAGARA